MSITFPRRLAPSGSPIRSWEIAHWAKCLITGLDHRDLLVDGIKQRFGVDNCFLYSTGRAAMSLLFSVLRDLSPDSGKNEVVIPGYTCYSVASSVIKAGLRVRVCDIDPNTLSYDLEQLRSVNFEAVLAIVSANLYGLPNDLPKLESLANQHGVFLIDDAAQSLNARVGGQFSGTFGSAGLFSLDKGKNITAMQGGLIVTDIDTLANALRSREKQMTTGNAIANTREYIKLLVYYGFLSPSLYWIPASLPFLRLGETRYDEDYPIDLLVSGLVPIACTQMERLDEITEKRIEVMSWYRDALPQHPSIRHLTPIADSQPVYLRYPLRILDPSIRERFLLESSALGVTGSYPKPIPEIPEIAARLSIQNNRYDNASTISKEITTLPTHAFVTPQDVYAVSAKLHACLK